MQFPVSGVEIPVFVPPLVSFCLGLVCVTAGVSGAFLLLPFQVSVLGFTAPAVVPTNLLYNIFGIPGAAYGFIRQGRMDWTLVCALVVGYLPGIFLGMVIRLLLLPDPRNFKLFIAAVLLFLALRMLIALRAERTGRRTLDVPPGARLTLVKRSWRRVALRLGDQEYGYPPWGVSGLGVLVGAVAGAYGIGGGAITAPLFLTLFRMPIHAMAGANLVATLVGSIAGLLYYTWLGPLLAGPDVLVKPDWELGILLGLGGLLGTYCGSRLQRYLPARPIKLLLAAMVLVLAGRYLLVVLT